MKTSLFFGLLAWVSFAQAGSAVQESGDNSRRVFHDLEYARVGETPLLLDLEIPGDVLNPALLVWIHGGGWQSGDKSPQPLEWLGPRGYALASINYRLSSEGVFPAQIHDCKAAIRWLRASAEGYGYDADRIGVVGGSAGGHLVALLGTTGGVEEVEGHVGQHLDVSSRVQAVVDFFGPTDFLLDTRTGSRKPHVSPKAVEQLLGGTPSSREELARMASPANFVTSDDPPILIVHGDIDRIVSVEQSLYLDSLYHQSGLYSELIRVPDKGHDGSIILDPEIRRKTAAFLDRFLLPKGKVSEESGPEAVKHSSFR